MSMKWIAIGLSLCAAAQVALLIWGRHIRGDVLSGLRIGVGVAMVGFGFALAFHAHERSQSGSSIQTRLDELKVRQANLELMKEDEALKKDVDEIQYELNAMKE